MKKLTAVLLVISLFFCTTAICFPKTNVQASTVFFPHILTTGDETDFSQKSKYSFETDGSCIYPMDIKQDGCLEISMYVKKSGYINVKVHKQADGKDLPDYLAFPCTQDRGNHYTARQYMKKGTYYLCFPKNSYQLEMILYPSITRTLTDGNNVAAYCDAAVSDTFSYYAKKNGYITINQKRLVETAASMSVAFYDSKGKKITDVVSDHDIATKIVFPVMKGKTYKIEIKTLNVDGQQYYQLYLDFTSLTEKSGSKKTKAVAQQLKKTFTGMVYAEDSIKQTDWYKISNPKNQKLKLDYSGYATSGSINLSIYNKNGKKLGTYYLMPSKNDSITYQIKNINQSQIIPSGTYYFKITKSRKQTAGMYQIKIYA